MKELPYVFDLLFDVKTLEQVERIAKYEGDCSDATPEELRSLFISEGLDLPECLEGVNRTDTEMLDWLITNRALVHTQPSLDNNVNLYYFVVYRNGSTSEQRLTAREAITNAMEEDHVSSRSREDEL